jgi:hypothetical protein
MILIGSSKAQQSLDHKDQQVQQVQQAQQAQLDQLGQAQTQMNYTQLHSWELSNAVNTKKLIPWSSYYYYKHSALHSAICYFNGCDQHRGN